MPWSCPNPAFLPRTLDVSRTGYVAPEKLSQNKTFFECRGGLLWNKLPIAIFQHETLRTLPSFLFQKIARFSTSSWHDPAGFRSLVHHDIHIPGGSPPGEAVGEAVAVPGWPIFQIAWRLLLWTARRRTAGMSFHDFWSSLRYSWCPLYVVYTNPFPLILTPPNNKHFR